ncbi:MAG: hydroxysqualene dehydroxylase HpnE [Acidobacteria bacterium]|nr:hydroxysqualene dehydroxylase HpnE [Acidobacteriota bacterium]
MTRPDAVVVGGGVAGLAAAAALVDRGARVTVVEARPMLGGRAGSYLDPATGEEVDNGQHILLGCYRESFAFLRRVGAASHVRVQPSLEVPYVDLGGIRTTLSCPLLPVPWHLVGAIIEWDALRWRDRLSVLGLGQVIRTAQRHLAGKTTRLAASPEETVENWLVRNGQSARLREMLWEPLALAALNQPPAEAAAPPFVRVLAEMFGPEPSASSIALPILSLREMYAEPARRYIEARGGEVLTNARVRVIVEHGRAVGIRVRDREEIRAASVISAVPWFALGDLFDEPPDRVGSLVAAASRMASYPIVTVNLWLDRRVLDTPFVGLPGRAMQWVFDRGQITGLSATLLSLVSSGAAAIVTEENDALVALAVKELGEAIPAARSAVVRAGSAAGGDRPPGVHPRG